MYVHILIFAVIAGYISANLYRRLEGYQWKLNVLVTLFMFMVFLMHPSAKMRLLFSACCFFRVLLLLSGLHSILLL